jgi:C1A family cysteine protease
LVKINGVPLETTYPYKGLTFTGSPYPTTDGICQAKESYTYAQDPSKTTFSVYRNLTNAQMKQLIANGPVGAAVYANTGFTTYSSGTYSGCPSFTSSYGSINHAVIIVGYDASGNYIIKNSWGTSWGDSGFGVVSKDADCALSAWVYQYTSNAAPGGGLVYTNLISL